MPLRFARREGAGNSKTSVFSQLFCEASSRKKKVRILVLLIFLWFLGRKEEMYRMIVLEAKEEVNMVREMEAKVFLWEGAFPCLVLVKRPE